MAYTRDESMPEEQVFITYCHKDKRWCDDLHTQLKPYLRDGSIHSWSDKQISPGSQWFSKIKSALADAKVAVLLVTPDFLASDFIHEHELGPLLKEAEQGGVKILWVPIRDSAYRRTPLMNYQAVLSPDTPLAAMTRGKRDRAWVRICEEIEKAVNLSQEPLFLLFREGKVKQEAPVQQNSPTATYRPPESITRQQREDATETFRLATERFAAGTGTLSDVISAHRQLTKVELDACRTSDERIAVLTTALKTAQELESDISSRFDAGTVPSIDVHQMRQYRLEAEIELAKLQSAPKN